MKEQSAESWRMVRAGLSGMLILVLIVIAYLAWSRGFREEPQPGWVRESPEMRFKYGSIGSEREAGIPYWIFYVLPRIFPEKLRQDGRQVAGGYAALGVAWEEGQELPIGFTKKTIGYARVGNNCALCHTTSYRRSAEASPAFLIAGPGHTVNVQSYFRFLIDCAKDPRFNPDILMAEINRVTRLDLIDRLLYRFAIIPLTKKRLLEREGQLLWPYRHDLPEWGRGRDDAMNLTRFFMVRTPTDNIFGPADIPAIWNLQKYRAGQRLNYAADSYDARSVIIDSALGVLGAAPADKTDFLVQVDWLQGYLSTLPAPAYPFPIDPLRAAQGRRLFDTHCARCHLGARVGMPLALGAVGTDRGRFDSWNRDAAIKANRIVAAMGIARAGLVEESLIGYRIPHLDGLWARAPYLHNGSVPSLRDLLEPAARRPRLFWRGYDVYDPLRVGFVSDGADAERSGTRMDTGVRGGGNGGHEFGTALSARQKDALVEYLKTL